jgi:pilus assembly protein Flp/PilA
MLKKTVTNKISVQTPLKNQRGQGLIEYLILVALIAVATIGVVKVVGNNMATQYERINRAMGAANSGDLKIENASASALKQKDLSNFIDSARSQK